MMSNTTAIHSMPTKHIVRGILRHLKKSSSPTSHEMLKTYVLGQFRQGSDDVNSKQLAYDYWKLLSDLTERKRLHELDGGAENKLSPRELSRRSAAKAGLLLPEQFSES